MSFVCVFSFKKYLATLCLSIEMVAESHLHACYLFAVGQDQSYYETFMRWAWGFADPSHFVYADLRQLKDRGPHCRGASIRRSHWNGDPSLNFCNEAVISEFRDWAADEVEEFVHKLLCILKSSRVAFGIVGCSGGNHRATFFTVTALQKLEQLWYWKPRINCRVYALSRFNRCDHFRMYDALEAEAYSLLGPNLDCEPLVSATTFGVIRRITITRSGAYGFIAAPRHSCYFFHTQEQWTHLTADELWTWVRGMLGCPVYFRPMPVCRRALPGSMRIMFAYDSWLRVAEPRYQLK